MSSNQPATVSSAPIIISVAGAILGFSFAAVSTSDFVKHLDRDVHGLQCSFLPGLGTADVSGESGCYATLMSPYSSIMRESLWGGVPISLPAMAVFAFLAAWGLALLILRRQNDRAATGFTVLAWVLPVSASAAMAYISFSTLDAVCKLCIGIYVSSFVGFMAALWAWRAAATASDGVESEDTWGLGQLVGAFAAGVLFVLVPVGAYAASTPDFGEQIESCGTLLDPSDPHEVLLPIGPQTHEIPAIEVLDPLCPLCRGFERRFLASSAPSQVSRRVLLFPLDSECNWMLDEPLHPGACSVSEAVLCAEDEAKAVIEWAFDNQKRIMEATKKDPGAAAKMASERFPSLAECIGSAKVKAKLNGSLRWGVKNQLPILTPQMYVGQRKLCDADTDLGMEYSINQLFAMHRANPNPVPNPEQESEQVIATAAAATAKDGAKTAAKPEKKSINLGPPPGSERDEDELSDARDAGPPLVTDASAASADLAAVVAKDSGSNSLDDLARAAEEVETTESPQSGSGAAVEEPTSGEQNVEEQSP